jgi:hypothetical protein
MFKFLVLMISSIALAGCNSANSRVSNVAFGHSKGLVTSGNLRLVTEREKYGYPPVVCTEPSPDYMVAFGTERKFTGSSPTTAGARSVEVNLATTEEVSEGKGREAAVLALRDGLYTACQSYANGVIGQDAYAIILSQYGNLLVALVGNDNAAKNIQVSGPQAAISAMTVACISGHDPSRFKNHSNALLTYDFCQKLLARVANRGISPVGAGIVKGGERKVEKTKEQQAPTPNHATGANVTTTTTTSTVAK